MSGIIGHLADDKKGIRENFEGQYFEFYVAGYTKKCQGVNVQANHARLFSDGAKLGAPTDDKNIYLWPFGERSHIIATAELVPEPTNKFDPNALVVKVQYPLNFEAFMKDESASTTELILGYVPQRISRIVSHHMNRVGKGWIKKTRSIHNGKHCTTKIAIPWKVDTSEAEAAFLDRMGAVFDAMEDDDV